MNCVSNTKEKAILTLVITRNKYMFILKIRNKALILQIVTFALPKGKFVP